MSLNANDADGWPILPGARIRGNRGYTLRRRPKERRSVDIAQDDDASLLEEPQAAPEERYVPTDECIVIAVVPRPKTGGVAIEARCTVTHGIRTYAPEAVRVVRGDSKKSLVVKEMTELKIVREKKRERKEAIAVATKEAQEISKKKRSRPVPQEAALTESSAPSEDSRQVPEDLSFLD